MIEYTILPMETFQAFNFSDSFAGPLFPQSNKLIHWLPLFDRRAEDMDMIRHYHIATNKPTMAFFSGRPFIDQNINDKVTS